MIRPAAPADIPDILELIGELAAHHDEPDSAIATPDQLRTAFFGSNPSVYAQLACEDDDSAAQTGSGKVVGMAVYYRTFSTWQGVHGLWLEDLYVRPGARGGGYGKQLLAALARVCRDNGYSRLEWRVADWNEGAIGFYRSIGAAPMENWTTQRLSGAALEELADT